jgi:hypothetical protein
METYEREARSPVGDLDDVRRIDAWARDFAARAAGGVQSRDPRHDQKELS